jgi:D-3-phosphoglycerate dehydrogenase
LLAGVNIVSAPSVAKERGIAIDEVSRAAETDYESVITLAVTTQDRERSVSGTAFHDGKPRIVAINGIEVDALVAPVMIYVSNEDKPGFIGRFASLLGSAAINIATFALGRDREGGSAIALVEVDGPVPEKVLAEIATLPGVKEAKALAF